VFSQDVAGLGGSVKYFRTTGETAKYWDLGGRWIFSVRAEGGSVIPFGKDRGLSGDRVRLNDRFFLGEPQMRGFDIRGVGPRVQRVPYIKDPVTGAVTLSTDRATIVDDALGGRAYYVGHLELELPLSSAIRELGIRPSIFVDAGSVFNLRRPVLQDYLPTDPALQRPVLGLDGLRQCTNGAATPTLTPLPAGAMCPTGTTLYTSAVSSGFKEFYYGGSAKPRLSIGIGFNWNSPFGPLRLDFAKALLKQKGDDTKLFTFNVGTQF
jgi:outer membrane protein insertion porin family